MPGSIRGIAIGVLGVPIWWAAMMVGWNTKQGWLFLDPGAYSDSGNDRLDLAFPLIVGPIFAICFSVILSIIIERFALLGRFGRFSVSAFWVAAGCYALPLIVLFGVAQVTLAFQSNNTEIFGPFMFSGIIYAGPLPLIIWSTLGGIAHGLGRSHKLRSAN